jgi:hypothetical protein
VDEPNKPNRTYCSVCPHVALCLPFGWKITNYHVSVRRGRKYIHCLARHYKTERIYQPYPTSFVTDRSIREQ